MTIAGNFGSYTGTGENIGGQQATGIRHCLFPPGTVFPSGTNADDYLDTTPDRCTIPGSSAVTGNPVPSTSEHCVFPSGTVFPPGTSADDYVNTSPVRCTIPPDPPVTGTPTTTVTGVDYGMDE